MSTDSPSGGTAISGLTGDSTPSSADVTSTSGRGSSGGAGRGRGNRRRHRGRGRGGRGGIPRGPMTTPATIFEGREDGLKGHVYHMTDPSTSAKLYDKTTDEIAGWAGRELKMGNYVKRAIEKMSDVVLDKPTQPTADAVSGVIPDVDKEIYREEVKQYVSDKKLLQRDMMKVYSVIYGQCSDEVRAKLEAMENHETLANEGNPLGLLRNIHTVMTNYQTTTYMPLAIHKGKRSLYRFKQKKDATVAEYHKDFKSLLDVVEFNGGTFGAESGLIAAALKHAGVSSPELATSDQMLAAQHTARDAAVAIAFIQGADQVRFGKLREDLENGFTQGTDKYPKNLTDAYRLLTNWKQDARNHVQTTSARNSEGNSTAGEVAFTNVGTEYDSDSSEDATQVALANVGRNNQPDLSHVRCYNCQQLGHYASGCPNEHVPRNRDAEQSETQMLLHGIETTSDSEFSFHLDTKKKEGLPDDWILLDNQSTVNLYKNPRLLHNLRQMDRHVKVHCNAGVLRTNVAGQMKGFPGLVWYHPKAIANILSFDKVEAHFPITYKKESGFMVHKPDGTVRQFTKSDRGLFYTVAEKNSDSLGGTSDTTTEPTETSTTSPGEDEAALVNTVAENKLNYTVKDYRKAELARKVQNIIGRPCLRDYLRIVDNHELPNCPITRRDVLAAEDIFGPNLGSLKGKTVRRQPLAVRQNHVTLPPDVYLRNQSVTIAMDIMFVNKIPFLMTISNGIKFRTAEFLPNHQQPTVLAAITRIRNLYRLGGFSLDICRADKEFQPLQTDLHDMGITMNIASDDEHIPEIERSIHTVKERVRSIWNTLPFTRIPSRMIIEIVKGCTTWLNMFPANDGISTTLSPWTIITGEQIDFNRHCKIECGAYAQTHEEHDNSMQTRTIGAIALRPTGNAQGGFYFLSLSTGRRIDRSQWTELPMPDDVISRVHQLARRSHSATGLTFGWRDGTAILDEHDDENSIDDPDYDPSADEYDSDDSDADDDDDHAPLAGVNNNNNNPEDPEDDAEADAENDAEDEHNQDPQQPAIHDNNNDNPPQVSDAEDPSENTGVDADDDEHPVENTGVRQAELQPETVFEGEESDDEDGEDDDTPEHEQDIAEQMDERYGTRTKEGLRPRKQPNYDHHLWVTKPNDHTLTNAHELEHTALTQYSVKKGLQVFGEAGAEAVISEMRQLDTMDVLEPKKAALLTREEKKQALEYLMFLKKKRCGRIKGRGCADGRKQRVYKTKEETSSLTVTTESLFLSCTIDAKEGRAVATCDIPGAFMQADMDDVVHVRLSGPLADLLTRVDPKKYKKFVVKERGKSVLYVRLKKALYGTLQAALLFWKDLSNELKEWGFTTNPYDECVANKTINGTQCTVLWHVDDLKISHIDPAVVDDIIARLNNRCIRKGCATNYHQGKGA